MRSLALPIVFVLGLAGLPVEAAYFTVNTESFARSYEADANGSTLTLSEALRLANGVPLGNGRPTSGGLDCIDNGEKLRINLEEGSWSGGSTCWTLAAIPARATATDDIQFDGGYSIQVSTTELLGDGDRLLGSNSDLSGFGGSAVGLVLAGAGSVGTGSLVRDLRFYDFSTAGILCDGCQKVELYALRLQGNGDGFFAHPNSVAQRNPDHLKIGGIVDGGNLIVSNAGDGIRIVADPAYTLPADFDIEIRGNGIGDDLTEVFSGNGGDGIDLQNIRQAQIGGPNAADRNLVNANLGSGIRIGDLYADSNLIEGNFIGLDLTGLIARGNSEGGILLEGGAGVNLIRGNRIAGNGGPGVSVVGDDSDGNRLRANRIGTTADGLLARPNQVAGVRIAGAADDTEVGECFVPANGNLISGNNGWGVVVLGPGTDGTDICQNFIGTNPAGTAAMANASDGVRIQNVVNGASVTANLISGNGGAGVGVQDPGTSGISIAENKVGTNLAMDAAIPNVGSGISLTAETGANSIALNVIAGNGVAGIMIDNSDSNLVDANVVGVAGVASVAGILLLGGSQSNDIEDNVIGAHSYVGLVVAGGSSFNDVYRNRIGTNAAGDTANPNAIGLGVGEASTGNTIGGANASLGNLISGNSFSGIEVFGAGTSSNTIRFNLVGTNAGGSAAIANGNNGIYVSSGASGNSFLDNVVSGNTQSGISLVSAGTSATLQRNHVGVGSNPAIAIPNGFNGIHVNGAEGPVNLGGVNPTDENLVAHNVLAGLRIEGATTTTLNGQDRFWANGGLAIDLAAAGVTANDLLDADAGPNGTLNMPVIRSARVTAGTLAAEIKYHGAPSTTHRIYLYSNSSCDASLHGEGETVVAQQTVVTDANGNGVTTISTAGTVGAVLSAVATRNTAPSVVSEFSTCRTAVAGTSSLIFDDRLESGFVDAWSSWSP